MFDKKVFSIVLLLFLVLMFSPFTVAEGENSLSYEEAVQILQTLDTTIEEVSGEVNTVTYQDAISVLEALDTNIVDEDVEVIKKDNDYSLDGTKVRRKSRKRGTFMLWTRTTVKWTYDGDIITKSYATQTSGCVFPNTVTELGIDSVEWGSDHIEFFSKFVVGVGILTPWGSVNLVSKTVIDTANIYGSGAGSIK